MLEGEDLLAIAGRKLEDARLMMHAGAGHIAAREAYLSSMASARAILFQLQKLSTKTHKGVLTMDSKLAHARPDLNLPDAVTFFEGLDTKTDVDYLASRDIDDPDRHLDSAERFLVAATRILRDEQADGE